MTRLISVVVALAAALLIWLAGLALGIVATVHFGSDTVAVGLPSIIGAVALAGIAAWGVDALVRHKMRHPQRVWLTICAVVLAVSLLGPLTQAVSLVSATVLLLMHVAVAIVIALGFTWRRAPSCAVSS